MKIFRTNKGTELPIMSLKGKDYLMVCYRLVWMREEHPEWGIATEIVKMTEDACVCRATIFGGDNRILATATKCEDKRGFADFVEKAETGAVGRALAMCGYGTQFAPELDEGDRIVDSPISLSNKETKPTQSGNNPFSSKATTTPQSNQEKKSVKDAFDFNGPTIQTKGNK